MVKPYDYTRRWGQGRGGYLTKFYIYGRLHSEVRPLTVFERKGTPLVYLLLTNGTPFTHYLV